MDLSKLVIEPRVRNGWEAIELGVILARRWWLPLLTVWLVPSLVLYLLLSFLFSDITWLAIVVVWWLLPLWERLPLVLMSRALFEEPIAIGATLRRCLSIYKTDCIASLTWRRFSFTRSCDMPVTVLEGLRGDARARRLKVLHHRTSNAAGWLTCCCVLVEILWASGFWAIVSLLIPEELQFDWLGFLFGTQQLNWSHYCSATVYLALLLISPFYVAAGFSIYISRRIELEGWDIEIRFRHLVEKFQKQHHTRIANGKAAAWLLPLIVVGAMQICGPPAQAQTQEPREPPFVREYYGAVGESPVATEAKDKITDILSGEEFHHTQTDSGWRLKRRNEDNKLDDEQLNRLTSLDKLMTRIAEVFEVLVWISLAALVLFLLFKYRERLLSLIGRFETPAPQAKAPEILFGLDVREESLPDDVPTQVLQLWRDGAYREAVGLLYRATLSALIHEYAFSFYDGYTEQECIIVVRNGNDEALTDYVARLTKVWQMLAYAHHVPQTDDIEQLCQRWPDYFKQTASSDRADEESGRAA